MKFSLSFLVFLCFSYQPKLVHSDYIGRLCDPLWASQNGNSLYYPKTGMNINICVDHCNSTGAGKFPYAALIRGDQCVCGQSIANYTLCTGDPETDAPDCTTNCSLSSGKPCDLDPSMICGGKYWYSLYDASSQDIDTIHRCSTTFQDVCSGLQQNAKCTWECNVTEAECMAKNIQLEGTEFYTSKSSFCAAAAHNLRYVFGEVRAVTATRHQMSSPMTMFQGSWHYGLSSDWAQQHKNGRSYFTSPKLWNFAETDIFAVYDAMAGQGNCHMTPANGKYEMFQATVFNNSIVAITINETLRFTQDTGFSYCGLQNTSGSGLHLPTSYIPLVLPSKNSMIAAQHLARTAIKGENITIKFRLFGILPTGNNYGIEKRGHKFKNQVAVMENNTISMFLSSVTAGDAGFYIGYIIHSNGSMYTAISRLIVIDYQVPNAACMNHGLPRADGTCICPHPFKGKFCNDTCPSGHMGPSCQISCNTTSCQGTVLCQQDPSGCRCASGWWGTKCSEKCPNDRFGPDCIYSGCHCLNNTGCDGYTGKCSMGCADGWYGQACDLEGPYLKMAPFLTNKTFSGCVVNWHRWESMSSLNEVGPPQFYVLEQWENDSGWKMISNQSHGNPTYHWRVSNLTAFKPYEFRVRTQYHLKLQKPSPSVHYTPQCEQPKVAPNITNTTLLTNGSVYLEWVDPGSGTWRCPFVNITVIYTCTQLTCVAKPETNVVRVATNQTNMLITPVAYAKCEFQVSINNNPNKPATNSTVEHLAETTPEGVPSDVQNFQLFQSAEKIIAIWQEPKDVNGKISGYYIKVAKEKGKRAKRAADATSEGEYKLEPNQTTFEFKPENQKGEQVYKITIKAGNTVNNGSEKGMTKAFKPTGNKSEVVDTDKHIYFWVTIIILAIIVGVLVLFLIGIAFMACKNKQTDNERDYEISHIRGHHDRYREYGPSTEPRYVSGPTFHSFQRHRAIGTSEPPLRYEPGDDVKL